jgi:hypothetical protein
LVVFEVIHSYERNEYAMGEDQVIRLKSPGTPGPVEYALTEELREGARRLLVSAIETEVEFFLEPFREEKTTEGLNRMVRNGRLPSRTIQTGLGDLEGSMPRVRDRAGKVRFGSSILPPYLRRTKTIEGVVFKDGVREDAEKIAASSHLHP